jgi:DNA-binding transcriptional regulator/RsmH inhibitor MraZ
VAEGDEREVVYLVREPPKCKVRRITVCKPELHLAECDAIWNGNAYPDKEATTAAVRERTGRCEEMSLDAQGRITLSDPMREYLKLSPVEDCPLVVFVGVDRFYEIWNVDDYEQATGETVRPRDKSSGKTSAKKGDQ